MPQDALKGEFVLSPTKASHPQEASEAMHNQQEPKKEHTNHNHEHTHAGLFSSMLQYPGNVNFKHQEADEEVILLIRRDFITNLPWILSFLLLSLIPPVVGFTAPQFFPFISISPTLLTLTVIFYYLVLLGFALLYYTIWYFNVGLVTNKRIIDLDVPNILVNETSEARLNSVADVSFSQVGTVRSFFNYGDVNIQTEALKQNIEFNKAPEPNLIRKIVGDLVVHKPST